MQKLLIATTNKGKLKEISEFLEKFPLEMVSLSDLNIAYDVEEDGKTYEENSRKKAVEYAKLAGMPAISDDGGFEIEAWNGAPGIKSKRWVGEHATQEDLVNIMVQLAKEIPDDKRGAKFVAVETLALPTGEFWQVRSEIIGVIPTEPKFPVPSGLPYRSFFFLPELGKYYLETELTTEETKAYNHRYKALQKMTPIIKQVLSL